MKGRRVCAKREREIFHCWLIPQMSATAMAESVQAGARGTWVAGAQTVVLHSQAQLPEVGSKVEQQGLEQVLHCHIRWLNKLCHNTSPIIYPRLWTL